jgi:hypothetical protein
MIYDIKTVFMKHFVSSLISKSLCSGVRELVEGGD